MFGEIYSLVTFRLNRTCANTFELLVHIEYIKHNRVIDIKHLETPYV